MSRPVPFVSGDWGTSRLRLRLVTPGDLAVAAEAEEEIGIGRAFAEWRDAGEPKDREGFYLRTLSPTLGRLGPAAEGAPLVLSGMASSSIGLRELSYASTPFPLSGETLPVARIPPGVLPVETVLVSGVRTVDDVMRGEETQLIGLAAQGLGDGVYVLPGTHSKHVEVRGGRIERFRTYMTGEVFALLRDHSVLRPCLAPPAGPGAPFLRAVEEARGANLLGEAFAIRARSVLHGTPPEEAVQRLSGLLIGLELAELADDDRPILVAAAEPLRSSYGAALRRLGLAGRSRVLPADALTDAGIHGQSIILERFGRAGIP